TERTRGSVDLQTKVRCPLRLASLGSQAWHGLLSCSARCGAAVILVTCVSSETGTRAAATPFGRWASRANDAAGARGSFAATVGQPIAAYHCVGEPTPAATSMIDAGKCWVGASAGRECDQGQRSQPHLGQERTPRQPVGCLLGQSADPFKHGEPPLPE